MIYKGITTSGGPCYTPAFAGNPRRAAWSSCHLSILNELLSHGGQQSVGECGNGAHSCRESVVDSEPKAKGGQAMGHTKRKRGRGSVKPKRSTDTAPVKTRKTASKEKKEDWNTLGIEGKQRSRCALTRCRETQTLACAFAEAFFSLRALRGPHGLRAQSDRMSS